MLRKQAVHSITGHRWLSDWNGILLVVSPAQKTPKFSSWVTTRGTWPELEKLIPVQ